MAHPLPVFSDDDAPELTDEQIRERLHLAISAHVIELVKDKQLLRPSRELGLAVLEGVTEAVFRTVIDHGYLRFPQGHGSLKVARLKRNPQMKRLPTGEMVPMPEHRVKLRYEEGATVREALGMPPKTNYRRQFDRKSILLGKAEALLTGKDAKD